MKIPKPSKPEAPPFKRKRAPPPQATKLLAASLLAALVFMAVLAIVFVPRYLENLNPPQTTLLRLDLNTTGSPRVVVTFALYDFPVSGFNATLYRDNVTVGSLAKGLAYGTGGLAFTDANGDGKLDAGDSFSVTASVQGSYRFEVWQVDVPQGQRVGVASWTGALA